MLSVCLFASLIRRRRWQPRRTMSMENRLADNCAILTITLSYCADATFCVIALFMSQCDGVSNESSVISTKISQKRFSLCRLSALMLALRCSWQSFTTLFSKLHFRRKSISSISHKPLKWYEILARFFLAIGAVKSDYKLFNVKTRRSDFRVGRFSFFNFYSPVLVNMSLYHRHNPHMHTTFLPMKLFPVEFILLLRVMTRTP